MSRLVLCSACLRHVREDEAACPFCGADASAVVPAAALEEPSTSRVASVSARAAILFFGAVATGACGDGQPADGSNTTVVQPYGAPPRPDPTPSPTPPPTSPPPPDPNVVQPYGVPPVPMETPPAPNPSASSAPAGSAKTAPTVSSPVRIVPPYGAPPPPPPPAPKPSGTPKKK